MQGFNIFFKFLTLLYFGVEGGDLQMRSSSMLPAQMALILP